MQKLRVDYELSKANHQLFRQSRNYHLKLDLDPTVIGIAFDVYAISPTWMNMNAYKYAYEQFVKNSKEEAHGKSRWNDFRVQDGIGGSSGFLIGGAKIDPTSAFQLYSAGEYIYSEVHDAAGNRKDFSWTGSGVSGFNIIDEYDLTDNTDAAPSSPINTIPYDGLDDSQDDGQYDHMQNHGNNPPYGGTTMPNQCWTKVATLIANQADPGGNRLSTGYFEAPSGWVLVVASQALELDTDYLTMTAKEGKYKGVHAPNMLG